MAERYRGLFPARGRPGVCGKMFQDKLDSVTLVRYKVRVLHSCAREFGPRPGLGRRHHLLQVRPTCVRNFSKKKCKDYIDSVTLVRYKLRMLHSCARLTAPTESGSSTGKFLTREAQLWCSGAFAFRNRCSSARVDPHTAPSRAQREQAMPQIERERVIETEGTLPDGREVK